MRRAYFVGGKTFPSSCFCTELTFSAPTKNLDRLRLFRLTYSFSIKRERLEYGESSFDLLKKHLETIIQIFPIGVMLIDAKRIVGLLTFAAVDMLGFKRDPAIDLFESVPAPDCSR